MRDSDNFWSTQYGSDQPLETQAENIRAFYRIIDAQDIAWIEHCQRVSEEARDAGF